MISVMVSDKGQVTIPAAARKKLRIGAKSKLEVEVRENEIVLRPARRIRDVKGIFTDRAKGKADDWGTIRRKTEEAVARQVVEEDER